MVASERYRREVGRTCAPAQLCNVPRLLEVMEQRGVDGLVSLYGSNQYYLSSFSTHHSIPETDGMLPVVFSRHDPEHPILLVPDIDLARIPYQPTWIRDIRGYASAVLHPSVQASAEDMQPFVGPALFATAAWRRANGHGFYPGYAPAVRAAMQDLGLDRGTVAFDNLSTGLRLSSGYPDLKAVPGDGLIRHARASKTGPEVDLLRRAAAVNQRALERTVSAWERGMSWHDIQFTYQVQALKLGGTPNLPDTMGIGHSDQTGGALHADIECLDAPILEGTHVMFDCHGKLDGYCWDGGKTWAVGGSSSAATRRNWQATFAAARAIEQTARPGMRMGALVDCGLETYRKCGASRDGILIFFHGLGLDHLDRDTSVGDKNWTVQPDMVISTHIYFPGDQAERLFLEEIVLVTDHGNERLFTWNEDMLGC